jgi:hypothetical protein
MPAYGDVAWRGVEYMAVAPLRTGQQRYDGQMAQPQQFTRKAQPGFACFSG